MLSRKILSACIVFVCLAAAGCGTGIVEKLGDVSDHCELEWGQNGRFELTLQCT